MYQLLVEWLTKNRPPRSVPLCDFQFLKNSLKPCDIILIEGRSRVSDVIGWLTNSPWTHAALYVGRIDAIDDDQLRNIVSAHYEGTASDKVIIESVLQGTVVSNIEKYQLDHIRICRPSQLSKSDGNKAISYAAQSIGNSYNHRQIFDLARFLFPWNILPRKWASTLFRYKDSHTTKTVCSTLIAEAFGQINFPILPLVRSDESGEVEIFRRNPRLCTPSDFDYSPYFKIIKYPFLDFKHEGYHLLPWRGTAELSEEERDIYITPHPPDDVLS